MGVTEVVQVVILGLLQGIAEFLPISSSGHLVIAEALMGTKQPSAALNIALHLGSLGSILVVYRARIMRLAMNWRVMGMVILATLPLVLIGVPLKKLFDLLEERHWTPLLAGVGLLLTSFYMFRSQRLPGGAGSLEEVTPRQALLVGVFQAIAAAPGVSRSGSTIFAGLVGGMTRQGAADFSFLIAIPAILGATVLYSKDLYESGETGSLKLLLIGATVSFVTGIFVLRWLLKVVVAGDLRKFAWYCLGMGTCVLAWQGLRLLGTPGNLN